MLDQTLGWAVIWLPIALSVAFIFVPAKSEDAQQYIKWRYWLVAVAVLLGALSWWQQSRAIRASSADREKAITETSKQVSADVTKVVTSQYAQMIADQKAQILQLQNQLVAQGRDVRLIKGSNIVTGKSPVKVEVTNQNLPSEPQLANLSWAQEQTDSVEGKPTVTVSFRVDDILKIPAFIAICDKACKPIYAEAGVMSHRIDISWPGQSNLAGVFFDAPKPLPGGTACKLRIASVDSLPIKVVTFRILKESEIPVTLR
jgi:hypothetical protein